MASVVELSSREKKVAKPVERLETLLEQRDASMKQIMAAEEKRQFFYLMADQAYMKEVGEAPNELASIDAAIAALVSRHHAWLTRKLSKTIKLGESIIKVRIQPPEVDLPKNQDRVVKKLFELFGEKYVVFTPMPNKRAIAQAPHDDLELMKPFGVKVRRYLAILVQSPSESGAKTIFKRPYEKS